MLRTDAGEEAEKELRAAGATPLVPFPGVNRPWRSVHDRCGREITPSLSNVRRKGSACRHCSRIDAGAKRKAGLAAAAEATLRAGGWEPLEPYPGADRAWKVRHNACGTELRRSLDTIRSKPGSCNTCFRALHGHNVWTAESAAIAFAQVGLTPLEPFPGSSTKPWKARHEPCGRTVSPRLGNVAAGQGPCNLCGLERMAEALRTDPTRAEAEIRDAGFEPLVAFHSVDSPWRSIHVACGREAAPTLSNLRRGQGGCVACGLAALSERFRMPETQAREAMEQIGLIPLDPYPGSGRPWRCRHTCGREVSPTLSNAKAGRGICRYCNSAFPYDGPAIVYLVADREAVKIGIAAAGSSRIATHEALGWVEAWQLSVPTGDDAYALEQAIVTWWRDVLRAPQYYSADRMPQYGATETVAWDAAAPSVVLDAVLSLARSAAIEVSLISRTLVADDNRPHCAATNIGPRARRRQPTQPALFELESLTDSA